MAMKKVREHFDGERKYWALTLLLAGLLFGLPVLRALLPTGAERFLTQAVLVAILVSASFAIGHHRFLKLMFAVIAAATVLAISTEIAPSFVGAIAWHIVLLLSVTLLGSGIVQRTLQEVRVSLDTVMGAVCAYTLFGLAFAVLHSLVFIVDNDAYRGFHAMDGGVLAEPALYYSLVTLTTLGFGDIVPASEIARSVTTLEAIFGQAFMAIIVARFVALEVSGNISVRTRAQGEATDISDE